MLCGAHMLVLRIIQELRQSSGGVFNVDEVLQQMVYGLEEEPSSAQGAASQRPMAGGPDNDWVPSLMQWAAAAAEGVADTQAAQTVEAVLGQDDDDDGDGAAGAGEVGGRPRASAHDGARQRGGVRTAAAAVGDDAGRQQRRRWRRRRGRGARLAGGGGAQAGGGRRPRNLCRRCRGRSGALGRAKGALEKAARSISEPTP